VWLKLHPAGPENVFSVIRYAEDILAIREMQPIDRHVGRSDREIGRHVARDAAQSIPDSNGPAGEGSDWADRIFIGCMA
jgi:hypothetical protein